MTQATKRQYNREYMRRARLKQGVKPTEHLRGERVRISSIILRDAMSRDGRTESDLARDAGITPNALFHILARGTTTEYVADSLASALGLHMSEVTL